LDPLDNILILPGAQDPKAWRGGRLEFADKERRWCLMMTGYVNLDMAVNTSMVKADDIKSFKDLLDPKWRGNIVATDPRVGGPGQPGFTFLYHSKKLGPDYITQLARQDLTLLRDRRLVVTNVAMGKHAIALFPDPTHVQPLIDAGTPLRPIGRLEEGSALVTGFGSVGLLNKAPHPNAAITYINWLLTKEGQTLLARSLAYASRRLDVSTDHLPPFMAPKTGESYFETDHEDTLKLRSLMVALSKKVFGE